uniref:Protein kinase domain-containing protein n=1 Tax=Alexandrium andersonii TaxID=327968 RepID=A0A7S2C446_9DINO
MAAKPNGMPGGTPGYIPPETLDTRTWFPRGDIFSMGVTIMQVVIDKIPPTGARTIHTPGGIFVEGCLTIQDIMQATKMREPPFHMMLATLPALTRLLKALLSKQMQPRPTAPQVLKDAWFTTDEPPAVRTRSKNAWATVGITKSFLARPSVSGEDLPPALAALREVQQSLASDEAPTLAVQDVHTTMPAAMASAPMPAPTFVHAIHRGPTSAPSTPSSTPWTSLPSATVGRRAEVAAPGLKPARKRVVIVG